MRKSLAGELKDALAKNQPVKKAPDEKEPAIGELAERIFTTRTLLHFDHWKTGSFSAHSALGELYDDIVDAVDDMVETYQGEFDTILSGLECECCSQPESIITRIKEDADWIKANRKEIANGSTVIENLLDGLSGLFNKALYKLKNLH